MPEGNDDPFGGPPPDEQAIPTPVPDQPQVDDPFGKAPTADQNLSSVRNSQFQELRDNPQLVGDLFSLTHQEVGTQGKEAQQAFIETVFNRAASRGQTLNQAMHDTGYYPKVSLRPAELSSSHIENYGNILSDVGQGSNISNGATGNASKNVRFAGGPQTFVAGGERFGIEGADVGKTPAPFSGQEVVGPDQNDPFGKPAPSELPSPSWAEAHDNKLADFAQGKSFTQGLGEGLVDQLKGMVPTTQEGVQQFGQTMAAPVDPNAFMKNAVMAALSDMSQVQNAISSGKLSSYQSGKAIATIIPQAAMLIGGIKTSSRPAIPIAPGEIGGVRGSGKFRATYGVDKELGDMMEGIGASKESGGLRGEIAVRNLTQGLNPEQVSDLGRYLVSKRLESIHAPEGTTHEQILPQPEMQRIASDPKIAQALDYYRSDIKPAVEQLRLKAGLTEEAAAGKDPEFISLIKNEEPVPKQYGKVQQAGRLSKKTRFAKQATGQAQEYNTNVGDLVRESFSEATKKARVSDFYKAAHSKGFASPIVQYGPEGKEFSVFDDRSFDQGTPEGRTLLNQLRAATETPHQPSGPMMKGIRAVQRGTTTVALSANPAEVMNHMRRQFNVMSAKPPIGQGLLQRLSGLIPYIGPKGGAFVRTVFRDANSPEFQSTLQDIFDAGGGSSRSFQNLYDLKSPLAKWSGLKWLQNKTHRLLFGIPKGKGFNGWDLRMRVALEDIRRAAEGNKDPQRIREFANQIGQYGAHPDWIIGKLKEVNPYAGTSLPMRWTEMKQSIGLSGLKVPFMRRKFYQAETMLRGTGGTILGLAAANYLMSGKWPWENDKGHEFDLNTGVRSTDGKKVYVKFRVIAPELSRVVNTVGLPLLSRESTADRPDYLAAFGTSLANAGLSIVGGPAQNALLTATTGKVPYLVKSPGRAPEFMDIAQLPAGSKASRGLEQLKAAATSVNPLAEGLIPSNAKRHDVELPGALKYLERPVAGFHGIKPFGDVFTQSYEKKPPKHPQTIAQIAATRRRKARKQAQAGR